MRPRRQVHSMVTGTSHTALVLSHTVLVSIDSAVLLPCHCNSTFALLLWSQCSAGCTPATKAI